MYIGCHPSHEIPIMGFLLILHLIRYGSPWENHRPHWIPSAMVNIEKATWKMTIEIVDLPIEHGDFP